ncbi:hypothetical protein Cgig2_006024 [Carnegiea gigantea]|uniref:Tetraspanin n=1 Tax=Carnegiea gigantea TaxID=171969 RepID=A0A9Q1QS79_9CARY|nr:hypothetical protein Cgig2_006024 [Carnegiea gigantea]
MARLSNIIITTLNFLTTVLALAAIGTYIYLHFFHSNPTHCQRALERPVLAVGMTLLAVSLLGLIGSGLRVKGLLWAYLAVLAIIIMGWLVFSVFVLVVTNKGAGRAVSGFGFREYQVADYSHWLQKHVVNGKNWVEIRSCLVDANVCMGDNDVIYVKNGEGFLKDKLTPIQSGCCKPPTSCGFTPKNATYWEAPKPGPTTDSSDSDCKTWSNNQKKLCYNCNSCKAGVLANLRKEWRTFSITNAVILVLLLAIYMVACCAVHNNHHRHDHSSPKLTRAVGVRSSFP